MTTLRKNIKDASKRLSELFWSGAIDQEDANDIKAILNRAAKRSEKSLRNDKSNCGACAGKGRVPTDLWNKETMAMWEPCHVCHPDDVTLFYKAPEGARQHWFVGVR